MSYDPNPRYAVAGAEPVTGYRAPAEEVAARHPCVLAVDGPATLPWEQVAADLSEALRATGVSSRAVDVRASFVPWDELRRLTAGSELPGDPVFGRVSERSLADLFAERPHVSVRDAEVTVVFGPGSALLWHDILWYADVPKRHSLAAVQQGKGLNVGRPAGNPRSEQRLLFVDWPVLDRHKQELAKRIDRYLDLSDPGAPRSLDGDTLRDTLHDLSGRPFRTRPTYLPGPWGGQWLRRVLGIRTDGPNLAWSYELITPESGILLGCDEPVEVGFELMMAEQHERVLGTAIAERFGRSFPIRFDYLDTLDGGHLSIQCHPSEEYMRDVFGLPYTQHETYYVMVTKPGARIFLGLREDADLDAFRLEAERAQEPGRVFDPERHLQTVQAEAHRLYLIPAGTPHASGAGNVVLEISATPYLYTLRFYDWIRRDLDGGLRPVHVAHAFANLDPRRSGAAVRRELVPEPRTVRGENGWSELELGRLPDVFFAVHRLEFEDVVADDTRDRFHVLNLVEGDEVEIETEAGDVHRLAYAETIVVPAAVGGYRMRRVRGGACKVVKAFVP